MLNGRRVDVRHPEFVLSAVDDEASKKSISIFFYRNCNYVNICSLLGNRRRITWQKRKA